MLSYSKDQHTFLVKTSFISIMFDYNLQYFKSFMIQIVKILVQS